MGCRTRAAKSSLLRVVAAGREQVHHPGDGAAVVLVPDPAGRLPGRGAYVHLDPGCVALAERRRAFGRALRLTGTTDLRSLQAHVQPGAPDPPAPDPPAPDPPAPVPAVRGEQVDPPMSDHR